MRLSHGTDQASVRELASDSELAGNPYAARLFELHDTNGDGFLTWEEFLAAIHAMTRLGGEAERTECESRSVPMTQAPKPDTANPGPFISSEINGVIGPMRCQPCRDADQIINTTRERARI